MGFEWFLLPTRGRPLCVYGVWLVGDLARAGVGYEVYGELVGVLYDEVSVAPVFVL